ncbi:MAG TPA: hypothetical protein VE753_01695 [Gaiellaceae bacterium]|nr:hypothetical protein [Gaiellaceae bacterium]
MRRMLALSVIGAAVYAAGAGAAGGGPSPGVSYGPPGVLDHAGAVRYVALAAGPATTVAAQRVRGGRILRWGYVEGPFGIPIVAWDGSTGGLARNGRRLVLATPTYGTPTRFVVLDPRTLRVRARLSLRGAFAFDAISPGGSLMYLIQYLGKPSSGRYAVRALNLNTGKLYASAIVDRREPDEKMTGQPVTRAASRDGTWAYTLYGRTNDGPFVHALDTIHRRAFCVDLPWRSTPRWLGRTRLRVSGGELLLLVGRRTMATVDTRTFEVSR